MRRTAKRRARALTTTVLLGAALAPAGAAAAPTAYVTNESGSTVSQYDVASTGMLGAIGGAVPTPGGPNGVVVSPDGDSVYVLNRTASEYPTNAISQYDVGPTGALTPKAPPHVASQTELPAEGAIAPDGRHLYVATEAGTVDVYAIGPDGDLSAAGVVSLGPTFANAVAVSPDGGSVYVAVNGQGVRQYDRGAGGGLTPKTPASVAGEGRDLVFSPDGARLYLAGSQITRYDVGAGGGLTPGPAVAAPTASWAAVAPDGQHLYLGGTSGVTPVTLQPDGGLVVGTSLGTGLADVAVAPDGDSVYAVDRSGNAVRQYDRGPGGALTAKAPASVAAGVSPRELVLTPQADLAVAVGAAPSTIAGETVITATATNVAGDPTWSTVTVPVPADATYVGAATSEGACSGTGPVVCAVGALGQGQSATVTVRVQATRTGALPITASAAGLADDPDVTNGTDAGTANVLPRPGITTAPASAITQTTAAQNAVVAPSGTNTAHRFELGTAPGVYTTTVGTGAPSVAGLVSETATGLTPDTTYYVRAVAENDEGDVVHGAEISFATLPEPEEPQTIVKEVVKEVPGPTVTIEVPGPTVTRTVEVPVPGPAPQPAPKDTAAPAPSALALTRTGLQVTVSEAATVKATIELRRTRKVRGKTRTTWATVRTVTLRAPAAGPVTATLRALKPGTYRVRATATDAAGNTSRAVTRQAVVRTSRR